MNNYSTCTLTIFFEGPFWIGIIEREGSEKLQVARVVFGAQPTEGEIYSAILSQWANLNFSPAVETKRPKDIKNPKRRQREALRATQRTGIGTKSQQALSLAHELQKEKSDCEHKLNKEEKAKYRYALRQEKRRQKHRGH